MMYFRARYYDAGTGEFISRDPLEYVDGVSLYRGYLVPNGIDPRGLLGLFFGGTCEGRPGIEPEDQERCGWHPINRLNPRRVPGSIAQLSEEYADDGGGLFYEINFVSNLPARVDEAYEAACDYVCSKFSLDRKCHGKLDEYVIDAFGWSRGAIGAHMVSQRLNDEGCRCCEEADCCINGHRTVGEVCTTIIPVDVRFVGMLDAVNTRSGYNDLPNPAAISPNVGLAVHEQRDGTEDHRDDNAWAFVRQNFTGAEVNTWSLTHGEVGRNAPPRDHLRNAAKGVGVKWKQ